MIKKGIILAGGKGTRMSPLTKAVNKQLLPIYDKPLIFYPLSILMLCKIKDILIIVNKGQLNQYKKLIPNGKNLGIKISFKEQDKPKGLPDAFIIGEDFIGEDSVALILGDNIFYGHGLTDLLIDAVSNVTTKNMATIFGYHVKEPSRYGVVEFDKSNNAISIEEKPLNPKSNYAVTGLYFYPNDVVDKAHTVTPSARGELEITSINEMYLNENRIKVDLFGRGYAWLDTGSHEDLLEASKFIETIERRQGLKVACIEEIAFENGYISQKQLLATAKVMKNNQYGQYLLSL